MKTAFLLGLIAASLGAQEIKFDSDTISGLGARNIGSAQMSGRVTSLAAVRENGRLTVYVGSASGGVWKSVNDGTTFKPMFDKQPVQSIGALAIDPSAPKTVWAEQANPGPETALLSATEFINPPMAAITGPTWVSKRRSGLPRSWSIPRTAIRCTPARRGNYGATATIAGFIRPLTAARAGARS